MNICRGDTVIVISGDARDVGKKGKILTIDRKRERVVVEGVNIVKRHTKPSQTNQQGGIVQKEAPVHCSNVMPWCESAGKPSRIIRTRDDGGKRIRVYKINGETVETSR